MSKSRSNDEAPSREAVARGRLLAAWEPPPGAGDPVGAVASTFTFDAGFFEEELLGRFLSLESAPEDGRTYLIEREQKLGASPATVLVDRRHVSRSTTLAWDVLPVPVPASACQHSKVTVLAWGEVVRLIVASANLTRPAYRSSLEIFAALDFRNGGTVPFSVLDEALDFLRRMTERVPDPSEVDGNAGIDAPRARTVSLLESIRSLAKSFDLPKKWPRGEVEVHPVLLEPGRGDGVLDGLTRQWGNPPGPDEVWVLSPFWSQAADADREPLIEDLVPRMGARGDLDLHLFAPANEDTTSNRWIINLPDAVRRTAALNPRLQLSLRPVSMLRDGESRPLHAKAIWWGRGDDRELLLIGSSNASPSGLGIKAHPRNFEANLCFVGNGERKASRWFDECFPDVPCLEPEAAHLIGAGVDAEEEGGVPQVPAFFRWALLDRTGAQMELRLGFGSEGEPEEWRLSAEALGVVTDQKRYSQSGRPKVLSTSLPGDPAKTSPPTLIDVDWRTPDGSHRGQLPVNALNAESRSRPDLWQDIDLESLLELLSVAGPVHRQLAKILNRRAETHEAGVRPELDPHRRVDTTQFLLQRIRRVSRGLEGLLVRLKAPVLSEASLEWRVEGPLSPLFFARRLLESVNDAEEQRFLLAEVALVVGRAARDLAPGGVPNELVKARYQSVLSDLWSLLPAERGQTSADRYLEKVFERARA